jgi:hypothetical protein
MHRCLPHISQGLTSADDDAVFVDCGSLRSLQGLGSLTKLGRDLVLRNLASLTNTAGMGNLTSVGEWYTDEESVLLGG